MSDSDQIIESLCKLFARNKRVNVRLGIHNSKTYCERAGTIYFSEDGNIKEMDQTAFMQKFPGVFEAIKWIDR